MSDKIDNENHKTWIGELNSLLFYQLFDIHLSFFWRALCFVENELFYHHRTVSNKWIDVMNMILGYVISF